MRTVWPEPVTTGSTRLTCGECGATVSSMTPVVGDGAWCLNPCGHTGGEIRYEPINLEEQ